MSKRSDLLKSIIKKPVGEKPTFGTDPRDPWSAKYNVNEDATLNTFLKSRGLNPLHVTKDQKVSHSKKGEFLKWKKNHMFDRPVSETVDKKDAVTFDIPLLIRVLELAREDIKSDMDLHRVVERLINMRDQGMLTMDDYDTIANIKENHIAIAMGKMLDDEGSMVLDQLEQLERAIGMIRSYVGKDYTKQLPAWVQSKVTLATDYVDTVGNYLSSKNEEEIEIDGVVLETYYGPRADKLIAHSHALYKAGDKEKSKRAHTIAMKAGERYHKNPVNRDKAISSIMSGANKDYTSGKRYTGDSVEIEGTPIQEGSAALRLAQALRKEREARELKDKSREAAEKNEKAKQPTQQQEGTLDPKAATEAPCDCANNPDDTIPKGQKLIQMSKSARIIKSIYKRKNMKEEVLDETWKYHQYNSKEEASSAREAHHKWRDDKGMASGNPARLMPGNKVAYKGEFKGPKPMKEETFDTEKEDKSVATYGKKPKMTDSAKKIEATDGKTQAAAIMTGGTTLTGTPRDTVEIDPMMKLKPGLMGQSGQAIKPKNNNR